MVTTVEAGRLLDKALIPLGAEVVRGKVGDIAVAHLAKDLNAAIGVEPIGVYIQPESGFYPNSFLAALTLISSIKNSGDILAHFKGMPDFIRKQVKIPCEPEQKVRLMSAVLQNAASFGAGKVNTVDGLRIEFDDAWLLIRPSGTEPIFRIIAESTSERETNRILKKSVDNLKKLLD